MTKGDIRRMLLEVIKTLDYDLWKYFNEETSEDFDDAELQMEDLIEIVQRRMG